MKKDSGLEFRIIELEDKVKILSSVIKEMNCKHETVYYEEHCFDNPPSASLVCSDCGKYLDHIVGLDRIYKHKINTKKMEIEKLEKELEKELGSEKDDLRRSTI